MKAIEPAGPTPAEQAVRKRERLAVALRISGKSLEETAEAMGITSQYSAQIVSRLVARWRERNGVSIDERRLLDMDRIDAMWGIVMEAAQGGSPKAIGLAKELLFISQIVYGRGVQRVEGVVVHTTPAELEALRVARWDTLKDTPVGRVLADPTAFADPDQITEGEGEDGQQRRDGDDGGGVGAPTGGDPGAVAGDQGADDGAVGTPQGDAGGQDSKVDNVGDKVDNVGAPVPSAGPVKRHRFPHLHQGGMEAASRNRPGRMDEP